MKNEIYKYRYCVGMATYTIMSGVFGIDEILHLHDTSCTHSKPNCDIEVKMCENGKCYEFSKALNQNAKRYESFHKLEKFWATKEDAYIEALHLKAE